MVSSLPILMCFDRRLCPALLALWLVLVPALRAQDEEPIPGILLDTDYATFEYRLLGAFGDDADEFEKRAGGPVPFDPTAEAMQRGDFLRAYAEIGRTVDAEDRALVARGHGRAAWLLGRLGASHYAVDRANLGLPEPTAQGEVLLGRAWLLWHVGEFEWAEKEAALAARVPHPAPAWGLAEFRKFSAAHAKAAAAVKAAGTPEPAVTAAFLEHADRLLAAGAANRADWCYDEIVTKVRDAGAAATPAERALAVRAQIGLREALLAAWGGRMPGPDYSGVRFLMLEWARDAAVAAGSSRTDWEKFLAAAVEVLPDARTIDWAELDLHGALALAEKQAGVGPEWRERLKPLLADPRLRYASRLATTLARCRAHPGFGVMPEIADGAKFQEFMVLLAEESKALAGLRAQVPAGAAPLVDDFKLTQLEALTRLRLALREGKFEEARRQFAVFDERDSFFDADRDALKGAIDAGERQLFLDEVAAVEDGLMIESVAKVDLASAVGLAERWTALLTGATGDNADFERFLNYPPRDRDTISHIRHVRVLVAAKSGRVIAAERALAELEKWCAREGVPEFEHLASARDTVARLPMESDRFSGEMEPIWQAVKADKAELAMADQIRVLIRREPDRLAPRMLLALAQWRLVDDQGATQTLDELRRLVPTVKAVQATLDQMLDNNDTARVCGRLIARLRDAPAAERATVIQTARATASSYLNRVSRVHGQGEPVNPQKLQGQPYLTTMKANELLGHVHVAEGNLLRATQVLAALRSWSAAAEFQRLKPVVEAVPFTNDLPDEATRNAWRTLLEDRVIKGDELKGLHEVLKPWQEKSFTARLSYSLFLIRTTAFAGAVKDLEAMREIAGLNRAIGRQIDAALGWAREMNGNRTVLLFGMQDSLMEERRNLQAQLANYVDANRDALAEIYARDGQSEMTRHVDYLERRIKELGEQARAEERKDIDAQNSAVESRRRAQTYCLDQLRKLTL